jgi:UTP--glucose-1-phosphate uridylyltransferase
MKRKFLSIALLFSFCVKGIDMNITKVVIPAAGLGTRFLPITKSLPKEMLPLMNKPALHYVVQEGIDSGINHFCLVVSETKDAIKHYFSPDPALHAHLAKHNKLYYTQELDDIIKRAQFSYPLQKEMRGLGDAILMAKPHIKEGEFFGVILPDDLMFCSPEELPALKQLIEVAEREQAIVIAVMEVPMKEISAYGCIKIKSRLSDDVVEVEDIIEKPKPDQAFSNLAIVGRYIFSHHIFAAIEQTAPSSNGEVYLTDAMVRLARNGHKVLAYKLKGTRFDTGRPEGWLAANNYVGQEWIVQRVNAR